MDNPAADKNSKDEISLVDILHILNRRKWWFLSSWVMIVSLAVIYSYTATPLYQSTSKISIGTFPLYNKSVNLEAPYIVAERVKNFEKDIDATWEKKYPDFVTIYARGSDVEKVYKDLNTAVGLVLEEHKQQFEKYQRSLEAHKKALEQSLIGTEKRLAEIESAIKRVEKNNSTAYTLALMQLPGVQQHKYRVEIELADLAASEMLLKPTKVIVKPSKSSSPLKPNKVAIITAFILLGFFIGIFLVLLIESFTRVRK